VTEHVVDAVFRSAGKEPPEAELLLAPRGLSVETALAGLRRLRRGAADLAARVPRQQPPGRVYAPAAGADDAGAVGFDDVGGQEEAVSQLRSICQAIREPDSYR